MTTAATSSIRGATGVTWADTADLSIIVVNWNARPYLERCLRSIFDDAGSLEVEVIVVDNASRDGSAEMVAGSFPQVRLIGNKENRGFAAGNNQGLAVACGQYLLLLNPDTIVQPGTLASTLSFARRTPEAGVIGCQVWDSPQHIQRTCFRSPSLLNTALWVTGLSGRFSHTRWLGRAAYGPWDRTSTRTVDVVSGMFMLLPRTVFETVGPMDEGYFVYAEEADWCRRIRKAGWRCVFAPVGRILHVDGGNKSTDQVSLAMYVQLQRSMLRFHRIHDGRIVWLAAKVLFVVTMALRAAWWSLRSGRRRDGLAARKAAQAAAALVFHLRGREPAT